MSYKPLKKLTLCIESDFKEDVSIIFAEPTQEDLDKLINEKFVLNLVTNLLWIKKESKNGTENCEENSCEEKRKGEEVWIEMFQRERKRRIEKEITNAQDKIKEKKDLNNDGGEEDYNIEETNLVDRTEVVKVEPEINIQVKTELFENIDDEEGKAKLSHILGTIHYDKHDFPLIEEEYLFEENKKDSVIKSGKKLRKKDKTKKKKRKDISYEKQSCEICGKMVKSSYIEKHKMYHTDEKPFSCDECGKSFHEQKYMLAHKRIHTGEISCDVCGKAFSSTRLLIIHKRVHTGEKLFSCELCGKAYAGRGGFFLHMRMHKNERPYSCEICEKSFPQSHHLEKHKRVHTGEKPYQCDLCEKAFAAKWNLTVHIRTHTGEKPYTCDCGKTFSTVTGLNLHTRVVHKGEKIDSKPSDGKTYSCDLCEKTFAQLAHVKRHKKVHTGEKPYSCDTCGKMFAANWNLTVHKKIHTEKKL